MEQVRDCARLDEQRRWGTRARSGIGHGFCWGRCFGRALGRQYRGHVCQRVFNVAARRGHTRSRHAMSFSWSLPFLETHTHDHSRKHALIILNQPFSRELLQALWRSSQWHCCADGGANRLHDVLRSTANAASEADHRTERVYLCIPENTLLILYVFCRYLPDLIKGDLDSLRNDVQRYYASQVSYLFNSHRQTSTDIWES